jgi:bifunctional non-homologous end joining protein LigD
MDLRPMLATVADSTPLQQKGLVYEPKYDGIRALVLLARSGRTLTARLWSRNGNEKTAQFPEVVRALEAAAVGLKRPLVLDGEVVALDEQGRPAGFQRLQGRMHLLGEKDVRRAEAAQPAIFIAFDILQDGKEDVTRLPLTERRKRLEHYAQIVRVSEQVTGDARALYARAQKEGWEGLIAKEAASIYEPGRRSPAWRKIKLLHEEEFVIGGWTEPRQTRTHFGALLLGVYEDGQLVYVGHTGTGFDQKELGRVSALLKTRAQKQSPFSGPIKTNEPPHWVRPDLVAQIKFTEWTDDRKLRHPVYLGLRDDKPATDVRRERPVAPASKTSAGPAFKPVLPNAANDPAADSILDQLNALEAAKKDGVVILPDGERVKVTNLAKPFWPASAASPQRSGKPAPITKGELMRYYVEVAPLILPCVKDRPLVMKRFPNGVEKAAFYQHKVAERGQTQFVGGSLKTLLEMTQLAAISQDPWFSRAQAPHEADQAAIDLDPGEGATFAHVLDVARWVHDELQLLGVTGYPKTSGSRGMHVYVPLPPHTSYESGMLFCQIVATVIATRHPKTATVERMVRRRPRGTVYIDFLQNIEGKTLATAYSARASEYAGVSTPLTWTEVAGAIDPRDFTIRTAPARFRKTDDLWAGLRTGAAADLQAVFDKYR